MTWSDRPTNRPPSSLSPAKLVGLAKTWGPALVSVATAALSAYGFVQAELQRRIDAGIEQHSEDRSGTAHPPLRKRIDAALERCEALERRADPAEEKIEAMYKDLYEMYWFRVGEKAVELEPNRNMKAHVRARVQAAFVQLVKDGEPLKDAYRRALSVAAGLP